MKTLTLTGDENTPAMPMTEAYEKFAKVAPIAAEFAGIVAAKAGEAGSVSV